MTAASVATSSWDRKRIGSTSTRGGLTPRKRVAAEQLVVDRSRQDPVECSVGLGHRAEGEWLAVAADLGRQAGQPGAQRRRGELADLDVAEHGQDVVAEVGVVDPPGRRAQVDDRALPLGRPRGQGDPTAAGVDPQAVVDGRLLRPLVALGLLAGAERPRPLLAVESPEPHLVAGLPTPGLLLGDHRTSSSRPRRPRRNLRLPAEQAGAQEALAGFGFQGRWRDRTRVVKASPRAACGRP